MKKYLTAIILVISNLFPIIGFFLWGWDLRSLLLVYWSENIMIGFFNVLKMIMAQGVVSQNHKITDNISYSIDSIKILGKPAKPGDLNKGVFKSFEIVFFIMHFGIFTTVHGVFVTMLTIWLFEGSPENIETVIVSCLLQMVILLASHTFSFLYNFIGHKEYLQITASQLFFQPYPRVIIVHLSVLLGSFVFQVPGVGKYLPVFILVGFKTMVDLLMHLWQHRNLK